MHLVDHGFVISLMISAFLDPSWQIVDLHMIMSRRTVTLTMSTESDGGQSTGMDLTLSLAR